MASYQFLGSPNHCVRCCRGFWSLRDQHHTSLHGHSSDLQWSCSSRCRRWPFDCMGGRQLHLGHRRDHRVCPMGIEPLFCHDVLFYQDRSMVDLVSR
ncbi:hypothetical protein E4T42_04062 [Aureobasidium subglaciale]|nr:hypothetical protein E4T42_04062 [Aureobasidium subglaciale]